MRPAIDEDVHEVTRCCSQIFTLLEDGQLITHAGVSQPADREGNIHHGRKRERLQILALRLGSERYHRPVGAVEPTLADQVFMMAVSKKA
ncbi:MAG TPA: hypothetical protein VK208_02870 [Pyrinomonadaceae bacterium]|nr:hypothetical protein [Pyrinomonadaceae bacterium]